MKVNTIIFDFDGTIAQSLESMFMIFNRISGEYGFNKIDIKKVDTYRSKGVREVLKEMAIPIYKLPFIEKRFQQELSKEIEKIKPYEGLVDLLIGLNKKRIMMGILSSNSEYNVKRFLKNNKIDFFNFVYSGSSIFGKGKVLKRLIKSKKLDAEGVVYVGDETRDIQAAKEVGTKSIAVTWGLNTKEPLSLANPDWIIDTPKQLLDIFR